MVRLYCLTRIYKTSSNAFGNEPFYGEKVLSYNDEKADENLYTGIEEEQTARNICSNISQYYELTEISIGYKYVEDRKVYVMHFYRDDIRLCVIRMIRGAVRFRHATPNALDLTISTSRLFSKRIKFDLFMRIRWIKNSPTKQGIIDKKEEELYRTFAEERKNNEIFFRDNCESLFENIKIQMPNQSKANVLRTKMSRFLILIKCLCDPNIGSYKNVPVDYEYNQQVKCFLAERFWSSEKPRKDELNKAAQNFRDCQQMRWENFSMKNQSLEKLDAKRIICATLNHVEIFESSNILYPSFINMFAEKSNFKLLKNLTLDSCNIQELTDEFFDLLPKKLLFLCCSKNDITSISNKISKFTELNELDLYGNKNLDDNGIPWDSLPLNLGSLKLKNTNITIIPKQIQRLQKLDTLEVSSKNLKRIEWPEISDSIVSMVVEGGNQLNEIELTNKKKLTKFHIFQTGITGIDCTKLPAGGVENFKMSNNKLKEFDAKKNLEKTAFLSLANNGIEKIKWENMSTSLQVLLIEKNSLTSIDDGISHLINLTDFSAFSNKITNISQKFTKLQQLSSLYLTDNEISSLPKGFELLLNLKDLDLRKNKFDYRKMDLLETLWERLPTTLTTLRLTGNALHSLPCLLKEYDLTNLQVDDCKLSYICPNLYLKRENQNQIQNLNIGKNKGIRFLPFIPSKIYLPSNSKEESTDETSNFTIIIDKDMLIGKPATSYEPLYHFQKNIELKMKCKCCASCGNETEEAVIEQLMIMDFNLQISKGLKESDPIEDLSYTSAAELQFSSIILPGKFTTLPPGKWQSVIRTKLCLECLKLIKNRVIETQKSKTTKKSKLNESENEEIRIPLSSLLHLHNSTGKDSFLNATMNLLDAMKYLRNNICNNNSKTAIEIELANILRRNLYNVERVRSILPRDSFSSEPETVVSSLTNMMELLNYYNKQLLEFFHLRNERCKCKTTPSKIQYSFILSLSVGNVLSSQESFETILNRWYKYEPKFCFSCRRNTMQKPVIQISEKQKYLIVEINSWIKTSKNTMEEYSISSETFNSDCQTIFDKNWKLIAAVSNYESCDSEGKSIIKYSTWRRHKNTWIVISDDKFRIEDKLLADFKNYKFLLLEKIEENDVKNVSLPSSSACEKEMITVRKNVTHSNFLQTQQPVRHLVPEELMEVDDDYFDPNVLYAPLEQQYDASADNASNQYSEQIPYNGYEQFHQTIPDNYYPENSAYYPQQNYEQQQIHQISYQLPDSYNQNTELQNLQNNVADTSFLGQQHDTFLSAASSNQHHEQPGNYFDTFQQVTPDNPCLMNSTFCSQQNQGMPPVQLSYSNNQNLMSENSHSLTSFNSQTPENITNSFQNRITNLLPPINLPNYQHKNGNCSYPYVSNMTLEQQYDAPSSTSYKTNHPSMNDALQEATTDNDHSGSFTNFHYENLQQQEFHRQKNDVTSLSQTFNNFTDLQYETNASNPQISENINNNLHNLRPINLSNDQQENMDTNIYPIFENDSWFWDE